MVLSMTLFRPISLSTVGLISFLALTALTPVSVVAWCTKIASYFFVRNSTGSLRHASSIMIFFVEKYK